jgi:TP901 family phage tail tape measure protein
MGVNSGSQKLSYKANLDVSQAKRNALDLIKTLKELNITASTSAAPNTQGMNNYRQSQLQMQEALRQSRLETERLKQEQQRLRNELQQGRITQQTARTAVAELALQQRQLALQTRLAREAQVAASGSYREAQARLNALGREIRETAGGLNSMGGAQRERIAEYARLNAQLTEFDRRLGNNQRNVGNYRSALSGIGNTLTGLAAGYLSAYTAIAGAGKIVTTNAAIADSMADVRRTATLTESEADRLLETFKKFDTRTDLKGLLSIAGIGGQIGIAKEELEGFTRSIDSLAVVLSNEIPGGADAVATSLGKINGVFKTQAQEGTTVEESFNRTGSAILKLGQTGLATGEFLVDFTQRISGSAKSAGIALPVMLAYGSVLEEAGKSAEVAGTSVNRLLSGLSNNRKEYFAIAKLADSNLTLKEFTRLINNDTAAALNLFFKGLNSGNPSQTAFNDRLKSIPRLAGEARNTIIALAQKQVDLAEKVNQSTEAYEDASIIADQVAIKNDNLAASIDKISKTFENGTTSGGAAKFFKSIIDGANLALTAVFDFFNALDEGRRKLQLIEDRRLVDDAAGNVIPSNDPKAIQELAEARARLKAIGTAALNDEIKGRGIATADLMSAGKSEADIRKMLTGEIYKQSEAVARLNYNLAYIKDPKNVGAPLEAQIAKTNKLRVALAQQIAVVDALRAKLPKAEKASTDPKNDSTGLGDPQDEKLSARLAKQYETALTAQRKLQSDIDALTKKGTDKQLSSDQQEIESVKKKYKDMTDAATTYNANQAKIDAQLIAKGAKARGLRVNTSGLMEAQKTEIAAVVDKNESEKLKVTLDDLKKQYSDYEQYKSRVGYEEADKRYAKLLESGESYIKALEIRQDALDDIGKNKGGDEIDPTTNPLQKKLLEEERIKAIKEREKLEQDFYDYAYQAAMTYSQAIAGIDRDYYAKKKALGENATTEQIANLDREREERARSANEANAVAKSGYATLMMDFDAMTRGAVLKRLNEIKAGYAEEYRAGKLTAEQLARLTAEVNNQITSLNGNNVFNKITESIKRYKEALATLPKDSIGVENAQREMYGAIGEGAEAAAMGLSGIKDIFADLGIGGEKTQVVLGQVAGVLEGIGGIAQGLKNGDPVAVVAGSIKFLSSAIDIFNGKDRKLNRKIEAYKVQLASLGKAYQQLERDVNNSVGESYYSDSAKQIENLKAQQAELIKMRDAERSKKKSDKDKVAEYQAQIDEIPGKIADINKAISETLIQTNFKDLSNNLADAFADAFAAGEDAAGRFDDVFDKVIVNAVKNSLKLKILDPIVKKFTDDLTAYAQGNDNSVIGFDFETYRAKLKAAGQLVTNGLKEIEDYFPDLEKEATDNTKTGISGAIVGEALKEDTANRAMGLWQGTYDQTKKVVLGIGEMHRAIIDQVAHQKQTAANTKRGADNTDGLGDKLDAIIANTDPDSSGGTSLSQALRNSGIK